MSAEQPGYLPVPPAGSLGPEPKHQLWWERLRAVSFLLQGGGDDGGPAPPRRPGRVPVASGLVVWLSVSSMAPAPCRETHQDPALGSSACPLTQALGQIMSLEQIEALLASTTDHLAVCDLIRLLKMLSHLSLVACKMGALLTSPSQGCEN